MRAIGARLEWLMFARWHDARHWGALGVADVRALA